MTAARSLRLYQQQALANASPADVIDKLYQLGVSAAHAGDASKTRRVLVELLSSLNFDEGGDVAERLRDLYTFALEAAVRGDLPIVGELLSGLRDAWRQGVLGRPALAA